MRLCTLRHVRGIREGHAVSICLVFHVRHSGDPATARDYLMLFYAGLQYFLGSLLVLLQTELV